MSIDWNALQYAIGGAIFAIALGALIYMSVRLGTAKGNEDYWGKRRR